MYVQKPAFYELKDEYQDDWYRGYLCLDLEKNFSDIHLSLDITKNFFERASI